MDLKRHYDNLYRDALLKFKKGRYQTDKLINSPEDSRYGLTLLARPSEETITKIQRFLDRVREIEPQQYYYPPSSIHITVLAIISCHKGFNLDQIDDKAYIENIRNGLKGSESFEVEFKGITASPSCLLIQGFFKNQTLNVIRDNLRATFKQSPLPHSMDKRYVIQTAHSTVMRLKTVLLDSSRFIALLEEYRDYEFGSFTIDTMELVANDWYHKPEKVQKLYEFPLE